MELSSAFWWFILIGLGAQLVDGALGMAFGLVSSSVMLAMGIPPAQASAAIHTAEVFTTGASGVSHLVAGNVDKRLFLRLALPGAVGGAVGAYGLTQLPGEVIRPLIYLYLLVLAIIATIVPLNGSEEELSKIPMLIGVIAFVIIGEIVRILSARDRTEDYLGMGESGDPLAFDVAHGYMDPEELEAAGMGTGPERVVVEKTVVERIEPRDRK